MVISHTCLKIIKSGFFEAGILCVILWNSVVLAMSNPTEKEEDLSTTGYIFLVIYTIEMFLKMIALGILFGKNAYLKDYWNILDFVVVVTAYLPIFFPN